MNGIFFDNQLFRSYSNQQQLMDTHIYPLTFVLQGMKRYKNKWKQDTKHAYVTGVHVPLKENLRMCRFPYMHVCGCAHVLVCTCIWWCPGLCADVDVRALACVRECVRPRNLCAGLVYVVGLQKSQPRVCATRENHEALQEGDGRQKYPLTHHVTYERLILWTRRTQKQEL